MSKNTRPLQVDDIVRIIDDSPFNNKTGVVVNVHWLHCCVVITGSSRERGVWFEAHELKRIGRRRTKA